MAEVVIGGVVGEVAKPLVGSTVELVIQKVRQQASLLLYFSEDFNWLGRELSKIRGYLKDAELKSRENAEVKNWFQNIQDIAWDAEDILEECAVYTDSNNQSCGCSVRQWSYRWRMGRRINGIKERMKITLEEAARLDLISRVVSPTEPRASSSQEDIWRRSSILLEEKPVGMSERTEEVMECLKKPTTTRVMAVVGMGGLGKTLLAQHIFHKIKGNYSKAIWISVSQAFSVESLQRAVASQIDELNLRGNVEADAQKIHQCLQEVSSLIVLDDVWEIDSEVPFTRRIGLPCGANSRCQTIITTRSRQVCENIHADPVYKMELLSAEYSWDLFCRHAFQGQRPPKDLEGLAREMEKECAKLPLAVKTVGAAMAGIKSPQVWRSKLGELKHRGVDEMEPVMPTLRLSYDWLPAELKPCYLYLSLFPEDEEIDCEHLVSLWIAEGFIQMREGSTQLPSDIAWHYLSQLSNLCLIQLLESDFQKLSEDFFHRKTCKLHDLLRELCVSISKENKCLFGVGENFREFASQNGRSCRRLSLPKTDIDNIPDNVQCPPALRTLMFSHNHLSNYVPTNLFTNLKMLRVLDLSDTWIDTLPECVGNMKLLKVLNLGGNRIKYIPACVRRLSSLQHLQVYGVPEIPAWIGELKCMRHLNLTHRFGFLSMPKEVSQLICLETLRDCNIGVWNDENKLGI